MTELHLNLWWHRLPDLILVATAFFLVTPMPNKGMLAAIGAVMLIAMCLSLL